MYPAKQQIKIWFILPITQREILELFAAGFSPPLSYTPCLMLQLGERAAVFSVFAAGEGNVFSCDS